MINGFFLGADWAEQSGLMVAWPCNVEQLGDRLPRLQQAVALLVRALAEHSPVLVVAPENNAAEVRLACQNRADIMPVPASPFQPGLYGPWFLTDGTNGHAILTWQGKAGGSARKHAAAFQAVMFDAPLNLDGMVVAPNGAGTLVVSEAGLLSAERNPELSRQQVEERLALYLGARHVIWLGGGLAANQEGLLGAVRFVTPNHVLVAEAPEGNEDKVRLDAIALQLAGECDADHRDLTVSRIGANAGYGALSALDYVHTPDRILIASLPEGAPLAQLQRAVGKHVQEIALDPVLEELGGLNAIVRVLPPAAYVPSH